MNRAPSSLSGKIRHWLGTGANEIVVTLWTSLSFYLMFFTHGDNQFVLFAPLALGAVVLLAMTYNKPVIAKVDPLLTTGVFLLSFAILGSYLFNVERYDVVIICGNLASALLFFIALYTITTKMELDFKKLLIFQCLFSTPCFFLVLATSSVLWGRVTPEYLKTNYVGMMGLICLFGACSVRSILIAAVLAVVPLYVIVAMESRDSMLGCVVTFLIVVCYRLRDIGWRRARPFVAAAFLGGPILCVVLYLLGFDVFQHVSDAFESVTMINDEHRGVDSGGSGRTDLWAAALHLWMAQPIFGVGFKGLEPLMPDNLPSHNAYIQILAETGAVGLFSYLLIVVVALGRTFWRGERVLSEFPLRLSILLSYVVYGLLESRAFSFGNTYSLLFFLIAFDSSKFRVKPAQKVEVRLPAAATTVEAGVPTPAEMTLRSKD